MPVLARGTVIAGHRIESFVGRGGMGVVYRARQLGLDRVVALKVIAPELLEDADIRERFLQEARAAARIDHPNVIPVHAAGEEDGVAYIAMRFVDGLDLRTLVRRNGPLAPANAASLIAQAAAALDAIHAAGFVHRDVKPANLLVTGGGHVYLTDFGLAKQVITRSGATRTGGWVGTLDYVAPEQIRGGRVDARADVYALGGVLHFTLTGRVPFEREGQEAKLWAQLRDPPPVPSALVPALPHELDAVIARAMAKRADDRYLSAGDLARAARAGAAGAAPSEPERMVARGAASPHDAPVEPGIAGETPTASAARPTVVLPRSRRPRPAYVAAGAAVLAAGVVAFALRGEPKPTGAALTGQPTRTAATSTPTPTPTPTRTPATRVRVVETIHHVGSRPSGIALAGADAWVISHDSPWVTRISRTTGRRRRARTRVGLGANSIAVDGAALWVAVNAERQVVRIDARTGAITRRIPTPNPPTYVAAGPSGIWVGTNTRTGVGDEILRYDRSGALVSRTAVPNGIGSIALGGGALWIAEKLQPNVARLDVASGSLGPWAWLSETANALAYAAGRVWASVRGTDSIARIAAHTRSFRMSVAGHNPAQVAYGRGLLFVASYTDHTLVVLNPRTTKPAGKAVSVPYNPYAVAADGRGVWVTGLAGSTVTRLAYR